MKRTLLAIVAAIVMITSANAQKLTNIQAEASFITDKMMVELGLSKAHRNSILSINLSYLNGINSYRDIDAYGWQYRNKQLRRIMSPKQWRRFCESYYFYRPISWRQNTYVHNIYAKYPSKKSSFSGNRANKPVTFPAPANQRPVEAGSPHQPNYTAYNKNHGKPNRTGSTNTSNRSFGSMRR